MSMSESRCGGKHLKPDCTIGGLLIQLRYAESWNTLKLRKENHQSFQQIPTSKMSFQILKFWEILCYFLHRENLWTCAHWVSPGFDTTKTGARAWWCEPRPVFVTQCCYTPALSLPGPLANSPINALSSLSASFTLTSLTFHPLAMLQNQRISTDTPFETNTLSDTPFVSFPGFHEICHKAIKANEGGKTCCWK